MQTTTRRSSRMQLLAAVTIVVALLNPIHEAGAKGKRPKPNLLVKGLTVPGQDIIPYVLIEEDGDAWLKFVFKVKNKGRTASPKGVAAINFDGQPVQKKHFGSIDPGHTRTVRTIINAAPIDPGTYPVFVCVRDGNCTRDLIITAIPERWNVEIFRHNRTEARGMYFQFATVYDTGEVDSNGDRVAIFSWAASGTVQEDSNGSDADCVYYGNGEVTHAPWGLDALVRGGLDISSNLDLYTAWIEDDVYTYPVSQVCTVPADSRSYQLHMRELKTTDAGSGGLGNGYPTMNPGDRVLSGDETYNGHRYTWNFAAAIP